MYKFLSEWPRVSRSPQDIQKLYGKSPLGLDLEFNDNKPTIIGLSDSGLNVSVRYEDGLPYFRRLLQLYPDTKFVGHNVIGADMFVLAKAGITLKVENMIDTIILHWLVNPHLCKGTSGKQVDEERGGAADRRGRGWMNLGTFASLYTDLPYWKACRGEPCSGPCPDHNEYWYNGVDALAPVVALPAVKRIAQLRGVDKLLPMHQELSYVLAQMQEYGVRIDMPYVTQLKKEFEEEKEEIARALPFNPDSPKQVVAYFKNEKIVLENAQEDTVREMVEELGEDDAPDELIALLDYKEIGNGPDRWFARQYRDPKTGYVEGFVDAEGYAHPHQAFFTSSSRLMCSGPNFHNVAKRRRSRKQCQCEHGRSEHAGGSCSRCACKLFVGYPIGRKIRRAIIAPDGYYIVRADFSNAENRNFLYLAGYEAPTGDLHSWMVDNIGLKEDDAFSVSLGSARDASKSVTHAADYGEGLQLKERAELYRPKIKAEIECGARIVFPEWTFKGKIVTFTGVNLARRAFGSATYENRTKANEITARYIDKTFPKIRDLQKRIFKQVEQENCVRPPHGYCLLSYGKDEDRLKTAMAVFGSQPIAHMLKLSILRSWERFKRDGQQRPCLSVHDELLAYCKAGNAPETGIGWLKEDMDVETPEMPGFRVPTDATYGPNWRDCKKLAR